MIIQCPDCASRYRTKDMPPGHADVHLACPKCQFLFTLIAPKTAADVPTVVSAPRVLIVDDALFFREMIADLLLPMKLNLRQAASAGEALALLAQGGFDLLLLDLNLPDKNGLELIGEIRQNARHAKIRVLAMSGVYRREDDAREAIRAGADDFLNKSFRPDDLRDKVRKLLSA